METDDRDWKQSVDNRLDHLVEQQGIMDGRLARVETQLADLKASVVTKADFAELIKSMTHYAAHVEHMLNAFSASHQSLESRFDTLERRVADLEKRIPPQAA